MNWYLKVIKEHYADFSGRARRTEYWMFILFQIIFAIVALILDGVLGMSLSSDLAYGWIYLIYILATFLPSLAVTVRRLHDIGKSGWWYFISIVPLIGSIWLLVLLCSDSEPGPNKWGNNPKEIGNDSLIDSIGTE
ncbi:DUF805 domain-containing protein [Xanthomarina sp. F1114]|uniref:DUF805 domain-containing protein n=1 Tax=Xanthomarina sp. F1114 TaxID=2996019 RepID=UPI00225E42D0|nr:DUF805 domain-containing protein [Xanthomarina sp. F1114]MCX7548118.1 DUF805 domain-containing protein [Xanthomarina sp. F1114]